MYKKKNLIKIRKLINLTATAMACSAHEEMVNRQNYKKRYWIRPFLRTRKEHGDYHLAVIKFLILILLTLILIYRKYI